jgi:hypothetical protein
MYSPTAIPAPLTGALAAVRAMSGDEARARLGRVPPDERAAWLAGLQQLADAVAAATITVTEVFDSQGDAQVLHGSSSTQSWLRGALRLTAGEASARVQVARSSRSHLGSAVTKLSQGALTEAHVRTIDRQLRRVPDERQEEAAELLTEFAEVATVAAVRAAGEHLAQVIDPDGSLADCNQQFERRYLTLAPLLDGMTAVDGLLDPQSAALLHTALEPFLTPIDASDQRTAAQRRADGLMQIVQSTADLGALPKSGGERTQLQVVLDPRDLGQIKATIPRALGGPAVLHPLSTERLSCDATMTPLILDDHGVVVSLGRSTRLFTAQQRKLMATRDGGCRWPGCTRPPAHTDGHHVHSWLDGGLTDVNNGLLLCRFHHRLVHEGQWSVTIDDATRGTNGPVTFVGPLSQRLGSDPRGP